MIVTTGKPLCYSDLFAWSFYMFLPPVRLCFALYIGLLRVEHLSNLIYVSICFLQSQQHQYQSFQLWGGCSGILHSDTFTLVVTSGNCRVTHGGQTGHEAKRQCCNRQLKQFEVLKKFWKYESRWVGMFGSLSLTPVDQILPNLHLTDHSLGRKSLAVGTS